MSEKTKSTGVITTESFVNFLNGNSDVNLTFSVRDRFLRRILGTNRQQVILTKNFGKTHSRSFEIGPEMAGPFTVANVWHKTGTDKAYSESDRRDVIYPYEELRVSILQRITLSEHVAWPQRFSLRYTSVEGAYVAQLTQIQGKQTFDYKGTWVFA